MNDYSIPINPEFYQHPQETWSADKCAKLAKRRPKDGMGTPGPVGSIPRHELGHYAHGPYCAYNGGTVINEEWYPGEQWPLPILADGFKLVIDGGGVFIVSQ